MKKLNGKQKTVVGFVAAIVSTAVYVFGGIFGWWPSVITPDEPKAKDPVVEAVDASLPDLKKDAKADASEKKVAKKATKKAQKSAKEEKK